VSFRPRDSKGTSTALARRAGQDAEATTSTAATGAYHHPAIPQKPQCSANAKPNLVANGSTSPR
jgi:hypothetical protein